MLSIGLTYNIAWLAQQIFCIFEQISRNEQISLVYNIHPLYKKGALELTLSNFKFAKWGISFNTYWNVEM